MIKYDIAGSWITNELLKSIEAKGHNIIPHYKFVKNKIDEHFVTEYLTEIKNDMSYENFWKNEIVRDIKENCLNVNEEAVTAYVF